MFKKLAFIFPGQGSQSVGMLWNLAAAHPEVIATFHAASEVLGYDLWKLIQEGPETELMLTERTQPMMLAAGVAVWQVWKAKGGQMPSLMAGHSLGEYSALVCAGSMDFQEAISLVADRGRFMQEAVPPGKGAIAAILGLEDQQVREICETAGQGEVVAAVNYNAPGQVVVAGHTGAVDRAQQLAMEAGAKRAMKLAMSVPAHSPLMEAALDRFTQRLADIRFLPPSTPVIHNFDLSSRQEPDELRDVLSKQLYNPVRWADTIRKMAQEGVDLVIECGPGKVLTAMNKRIEKGMTALPIFDETSLHKALENAGKLAGQGAKLPPAGLKPAFGYPGG
jgi:[acyl-carrier-protein] S-malonyltransferase